jgi:hypothetical protein
VRASIYRTQLLPEEPNYWFQYQDMSELQKLPRNAAGKSGCVVFTSSWQHKTSISTFPSHGIHQFSPVHQPNGSGMLKLPR